MWNTNQHLHRTQASFCSPEGEEALRPPQTDLRSPGKISTLGGYAHSRWEFSQKLVRLMSPSLSSANFNSEIPLTTNTFVFTPDLYPLIKAPPPQSISQCPKRYCMYL